MSSNCGVCKIAQSQFSHQNRFERPTPTPVYQPIKNQYHQKSNLYFRGQSTNTQNPYGQGQSTNVQDPYIQNQGPSPYVQSPYVQNQGPYIQNQGPSPYVRGPSPYAAQISRNPSCILGKNDVPCCSLPFSYYNGTL